LQQDYKGTSTNLQETIGSILFFIFCPEFSSGSFTDITNDL
jgi:hypothetical protein